MQQRKREEVSGYFAYLVSVVPCPLFSYEASLTAHVLGPLLLELVQHTNIFDVQHTIVWLQEMSNLQHTIIWLPYL